MLLRMLVDRPGGVPAVAAAVRCSGKYNPLGSNLATDVGIVLDHSLSTGRRTGDRTVFEQSVAALDGLTKPGVLRGSDTVSIVLAEHEPRRFTPLPVSPGRAARRAEQAAPAQARAVRRLDP